MDIWEDEGGLIPETVLEAVVPRFDFEVLDEENEICEDCEETVTKRLAVIDSTVDPEIIQHLADELAAGKSLLVMEAGTSWKQVFPDQETVLEEAERIINGPRAAYYGDARTNHQRIANLWNAYLDSRPHSGPLAAHEAAYLMVLMKIARLIESPDHRDSHVDVAGYIGVAWKIIEADKADNPILESMQ